MIYREITGNALDPQGPGRKVIVHCCNDIGEWGAGFVMAISSKCKKPETEYRKWAKDGYWNKSPFKLGQIQLIPFKAQRDVAICNLIGQSGCGKFHGLIPVRYQSIEEGFIRLRERMGTSKWSLHMPRMGCGLAGGEWNEIRGCIDRAFDVCDICVTVYDFG